jgi:autotransporter-associated beta strand protein
LINGADKPAGYAGQPGRTAIGASGSLSSPVISVASGATFDVSALGGGFTLGSGKTITGNGTIVGTLTGGSGSTLSAGTSIGALSVSGSLVLNGGATNLVEISASTNDVINVGGNLTLNGVNTIRLSILALLPAGQYPLIKYGSLTGDANNLVLQGYPVSRVSASLVVNAAGKSIDLVLTGSNGSVEWIGGSGGNAWDVNTTVNWLNGGSLSVFFNDDTVAFTDIGASFPLVNLVTPVIPGPITVNSSTDYTFRGIGKITGTATLTKSGPNTLNVLTTNDYSGTTVINSGTVLVGNGSASGSLGSGNITETRLWHEFARQPDVANTISGGQFDGAGGHTGLIGNNSYAPR